jgi:hypothetical protein
MEAGRNETYCNLLLGLCWSETVLCNSSLFLESNSINIIVFDCTKSLENILLFWMNSIQSMGFGSSILLVGSFTNQLKNKNEIEIISENVDRLITSWHNSILSSQKDPSFSDINGMEYLFHFIL